MRMKKEAAWYTWQAQSLKVTTRDDPIITGQVTAGGERLTFALSGPRPLFLCILDNAPLRYYGYLLFWTPRRRNRPRGKMCTKTPHCSLVAHIPPLFTVNVKYSLSSTHQCKRNTHLFILLFIRSWGLPSLLSRPSFNPLMMEFMQPSLCFLF